MNTVPKMISTKDLSYIEDMVNWNFYLGKAANHYEQECNIEEVQKMMHVVKEMHAKHVEELKTLLKEGQHEQS